MSVSPPRFRKVYDKRTKKWYKQYYVQTKSLDLLYHLKDIWYKERLKIVPTDWLNMYLTPLALSTWYQDDGHLKIESNIPRKIVLSTDAFVEDDCKLLRDTLYQKYKLNFSLDSQNRLLIYDQPSIYYFLSITWPYLSTCMKRKDIFYKRGNLINSKTRRTTIYVPNHIKISQPTSDIKSLFLHLPELAHLISRESGIQHVYLQTYKILSNSHTHRSYQVTLSPEQIDKLKLIRTHTGYTYGDIITICNLMKKGHLS